LKKKARIERKDDLPLALALEAIGDPWSFLVLQEAFFRVRRFEEFQRNLGIARNTLTDRLDRLVKFDLLAKHVYQERPLRHEYRLTDRGLDNYSYALCITTWGDEWLSGPEGPPVILHHLKCKRPVQAVCVCKSCLREIRAEDVAINPKTAQRVMKAKQRVAQVRYSSRPALYVAGHPTSVGRALAIIGDAWGFLIIWLAFAGITKFDHFHRNLGIARTILTARLERLLENGILERRRYQDRPPRFDYHLTAKGRSLCATFLTLYDWGQRCFGTSTANDDVFHKSCGHALKSTVICGHCEEVVKAHDVRVIERPSKPPQVLTSSVRVNASSE
jgi:DNA-binding HxlR family transcriptional regulator